MKIISKPRQSGKTLEIARYMIQPGNEDVICLCPSEAQAKRVVYPTACWLAEQEGLPAPHPDRFQGIATYRVDHRFTKRRVVIDELDGVLGHLLGATVEKATITESKE